MRHKVLIQNTRQGFVENSGKVDISLIMSKVISGNIDITPPLTRARQVLYETVQIPSKITKMDNHTESTIARGLSYNGDYSVVLTCHHHHHQNVCGFA